GMPKELVDGRGRVAWAAAHSAWGRVVEVQRDAGAADVASPFRLLGQYGDEETGLCYTRFRYFDAEAGRWCSPDPLGVDGGTNPGAWDGSTTSHQDPFGLCSKKIYRGMIATPDGPQIGPTARTLGARPGTDIVVDGER
ncbi:MAG: RHS domain-containing protein, partial [Myxococcales bacterium]|nr:RHS domain-containing protein [Myxococcales bacterium]